MTAVSKPLRSSKRAETGHLRHVNRDEILARASAIVEPSLREHCYVSLVVIARILLDTWL